MRGRTVKLAVCVALALCGCCALYYARRAPSFTLLPTVAAEAAVEEQQQQQQVPVFEATKEWQVIPKGAAIPPGLHVKLDLTTGERMGKLMDEDKEGGEAAQQQQQVGR